MSASPESRLRCAMCGKPQDEKFKPFCSKRCADLDLGKWLKGSYSLPGDPVAPDEIPDDDE